MSLAQMLVGTFFDVILSPFQGISPVWSLGLFSLLAGLLILGTFRYISDQQHIRETKNTIKAHILALWLFRDDLRTMLSAQGQILRLNARYLKLVVKPTLVLIVPITLMIVSLEGWFGYRPLRSGEVAIVAVHVRDGEAGLLERASLEANGALAVETPALRIPREGEVNWRIRPHKLGTYKVSVDLSGRRLEKKIVVSRGRARVSPSRLSSKFWQGLLYPDEPSIPQSTGVERIDIRYPESPIKLFHWKIHWLVYFFVLSIVFAVALKRIFRVEL